MEYIQATIDDVLISLGLVEIPEPVIEEPEPCEGFVECFWEGLENLAPPGVTDSLTVLENFRQDYVLYQALILLQVAMAFLFFRKPITSAAKGAWHIMLKWTNRLGRVLAYDDLKRLSVRVDELNNFCITRSDISEQLVSRLEKRVESIALDKDKLRQELKDFETIAASNMEDQLDITINWITWVEDTFEEQRKKEMEKETKYQKMIEAAKNKPTGIPIFANSPKPIKYIKPAPEKP